VAELPAEPRVFLFALGAFIFCGEGSEEDEAALKRELRRGFAGAFSSSPSFELVRETCRRIVRLTGETSGSGGTLSSSPLASSLKPPGTDVRVVLRDFAGRSCFGGEGGEWAIGAGFGRATSRSAWNAPGSGGSVVSLAYGAGSEGRGPGRELRKTGSENSITGTGSGGGARLLCRSAPSGLVSTPSCDTTFFCEDDSLMRGSSGCVALGWKSGDGL